MKPFKPEVRFSTCKEDRCDNFNDDGDIRCQLQAVIYTDDGRQFCAYCGPHFEPDHRAAMEALKEAGMI